MLIKRIKENVFFGVIFEGLLIILFSSILVGSDLKDDEKSPIRILSIDGGGVRGLVPALIIEKIEKEARRSVVDLFDMVAGTSIGGILGLYLTTPNHTGKYPQYTATDAVTMLEAKANQIFSGSAWWRFTTLGGLSGPKYDHNPLESLLKEKFGPRKTLKSCLRDTVVMSYDLERDHPHIFKSWEAKEKEAYDFPVWQVCRATSAAPTYFEPASIRNLNDEEYICIDGGVVANNPTMQAYVEAKKRYGSDRKILIFSVGTGAAIETTCSRTASRWGPIGWVQPVIRIAMSGVSNLVHQQMSVMSATHGDEYLRVQTTLRKGESDLDNCSGDNLKNLRHRAETTLDNNQDKIEEMVHKLLGKDEL